MKQVIIIITLIFFSLSKSYAQDKTETFPVKGTCEMCKGFIEKAAKKVKGVSRASWDIDKKEVEVTYNTSKATLEDIHKAIAKAGYETEMAPRNERAYKRLPSCCHYDAKPPNSLKTGH